MATASLSGQTYWLPGGAGYESLQGGGGDPYASSLQGAMQQLQAQGFTGPITAQQTLARPSPQQIESSYQSAYGPLAGQLQQAYAPTQAANFGEMNEADIARSFGMAEGPILEALRQQTGGALAEAGYGVGGSGSAPLGPYAELLNRGIQQQFTLPYAQALLGNKQTGAAARTSSAQQQASQLGGFYGQGAAGRAAAGYIPDVTSVSGSQPAGAGYASLSPTEMAKRSSTAWQEASMMGGGGGATSGKGGGAAGGSDSGLKNVNTGFDTSWGAGSGYSGLYSGAATMSPSTGEIGYSNPASTYWEGGWDPSGSGWWLPAGSYQFGQGLSSGGE